MKNELPVLAYSRQQVAKMLNISVPTIQRHVKTGKIRSVLIGDRRMIPAAELERLLTVGTEK